VDTYGDSDDFRPASRNDDCQSIDAWDVEQ